MQARIIDRFVAGPLPYWDRHAVGSAEVACRAGRLRFLLAGAVDKRVANAEIGDYRGHARGSLPWSPPLRVAIRARFSHRAGDLGGTSGFGFWNNPFEPVTGKVLTPPNSLWFFCASPRSDMVTTPGLPGNGFRAEMINGGTMPGWLMPLGNQLLKAPGLTALLYRLAQTRMNASGASLDGVEMTDWHDYVLFWRRSEAVFSVDEHEVLRVTRPSGIPLGFVAWMDNQVAVARPDGEFRFGMEAVPGPQWLDLEAIEIDVQ